MNYERMISELQTITKQISNIQDQLKKCPNGKLNYSFDGKYYKWYCSDKKTQRYIPAENISLAEQLALKKYLTAKLDDLQKEKRAIEFYLRHHRQFPGKAESLLTEVPGIQALLSSHFQPLSKELAEWANSDYETNPKFPEQRTHKTVSGHFVRSKSESMIATRLYTNQIPFQYEAALHLGTITLYPDFTIRHPKSGNFYYFEHFGRMDDPSYCKNTFAKLQLYSSYGIVPSIQLITTYETVSHPLDTHSVEKIIQEYFL